MDHGGDITVADDNGMTALLYAAVNPHTDVLQFVLDQGFYVDGCANIEGRSALFYAAYVGNLEGCQILLKHGAKVNRRHGRGQPPLMDAIIPHDNFTGRKIEVIELLLDHGAEVTGDILTAASRKVSNDVRYTLMRHMAKLEFLNSGINDDQRRMIESKDCYREYYWACISELESMKATKFYNNVSLFHVLMAKGKVLSGFARNEELAGALEKMEREEYCNNRFPVYFPRLKERFCAEVEKQRTRWAAAYSLSNVFGVNDPSHPVTQGILGCLTDKNLAFLCTNVSVVE